MPFAYYQKLSSQQKKIYLASDAITSLKLPWAERFEPFILALAEALQSEQQKDTQFYTKKFVDALCQVFQVSKVRLKVLAKRPSHNWGELHGLYEREEGSSPQITVWMRTAKRRQVVAFKTYLRTVLHEVLHHLDYELLKLSDSLHTEGFYKREASLTRQLLTPKILNRLSLLQGHPNAR